MCIATAICHAIVPAGVEMWLFTVMHGQMHVSGDSDKDGLAPNLMLSRSEIAKSLFIATAGTSVVATDAPGI